MKWFPLKDKLRVVKSDWPTSVRKSQKLSALSAGFPKRNSVRLETIERICSKSICTNRSLDLPRNLIQHNLFLNPGSHMSFISTMSISLVLFLATHGVVSDISSWTGDICQIAKSSVKALLVQRVNHNWCSLARAESVDRTRKLISQNDEECSRFIEDTFFSFFLLFFIDDTCINDSNFQVQETRGITALYWGKEVLRNGACSFTSLHRSSPLGSCTKMLRWSNCKTTVSYSESSASA